MAAENLGSQGKGRDGEGAHSMMTKLGSISESSAIVWGGPWNF